eukprot:scaffold64335_cov65-Phaeocystis_antarctica.AAC.3
MEWSAAARLGWDVRSHASHHSVSHNRKAKGHLQPAEGDASAKVLADHESLSPREGRTTILVASIAGLLSVEDRLRPDALVDLRVRLGERQRHELRERVLDEGRNEEVGVLDAVLLHRQRRGDLVAEADRVDGLRQGPDRTGLTQEIDRAVARQLRVRARTMIPARNDSVEQR